MIDWILVTITVACVCQTFYHIGHKAGKKMGYLEAMSDHYDKGVFHKIMH